MKILDGKLAAQAVKEKLKIAVEKLKAEGRFRTKVELWTDDDEIQIIR